MGRYAAELVAKVVNKNKEYNESWRKRGGVDSFMMLARKWDRLEEQVARHGWNILAAQAADARPEGIADDIDDLIGYLLLVREHALREAEERQQTPAEPAAEPGRAYLDPDGAPGERVWLDVAASRRRARAETAQQAWTQPGPQDSKL